MDEIKLLQELSDISRRIPGGVGDVRAAVWERIRNGAVSIDNAPVDDAPFATTGGRGFELGLNMAAAVILAVSAGVLHNTLSSLMSEVFWHNALYSLYSYF